MKRILFLASLFAAALSAQTPDCLPPAQLIQSGSGNVPAPNGYFDNRAIQCQTWTVAYQSDDVGGVTLVFEYATGTSAPGSWSALTPVASSASFGNAEAPFGVATFNVLSATAGSSIPAPWLRVNVTGGTGGTVRIELYGYRTGGGGGGGGGGVGGCPNPCPVTQSTIPWLVSQVGDGTFSAAQQTVTGSAAALGTNTSKAVCVIALAANTGTVYLGGSSVSATVGFPLVAGANACATVSNTNLLYIIGTASDKVAYDWVN